MASEPSASFKKKVPPPWKGKASSASVLIWFFVIGFIASVVTALALVARLNEKEKNLASLYEQNQELKQNNELLTRQSLQLRADNQNKSSDLRTQAQEVSEKKRILEKMMEADRKRRAYDAKIQELSNQAESGLSKVLPAGDYTINHRNNEIVIQLPDKIFFKSGDATLKPESQKVLQAIATLLNQQLKEALVRIEGNTDATPVGAALKAKFPSNWELSAVRATSAVRFLEQEGKVEASRLSAVGRGSTNPMILENNSGDTTKNRRIEIILTLPPYLPEPADAESAN